MKQLVPPEIEVFLKKHAGGRMPSLVDVERTRAGLLDIKVMRLLHNGLRSELPASFGILIAADGYGSEDSLVFEHKRSSRVFAHLVPERSVAPTR